MAASGPGVSVLAPNGRRQTVKVTPRTTLLQVLEEVCNKQNFNSRDYNLKFQRTVLDLSVQWRFAKLPNNAKLEMVSCSQQRAGTERTKIRVALQLEDGGRLQDEFLCSHTLWEILSHFPQTKVCLEEVPLGSIAVCIYMRDEVSGEQSLKQTTLQTLGLTSGSAIIRFVLRKSNQPESRETDRVQADKERESAPVYKVVTPPDTEYVNDKATVGQEEVVSENRDTHSLRTSQKDVEAENRDIHSLRTSQKDVEAENRDTHSLRMSQKDVEAENRDTHSLRTSQKDVEAENRDTDSLRTSQKDVEAENRDTDSLRTSQKDLEAEASYSSSSVKSSVKDLQQNVSSDQPGPSTSDEPPSRAASFTPFQGGGHRLGGAIAPSVSPEADALCANAQESVCSPGPSKPKKSKTDAEDSGSETIDREPLVCHMDLQEHIPGSSQVLPDDFFEVTMDDVRRRFAELRSERQRLEEAPMVTKALRDAQLKERMERYSKVALRIVFPDRYILQGFFHVTETLGAVREFVSSHLEDLTVPFYLFITPPRTELTDDSQTLFQAQLFPAAVVHFGSLTPRDHFLSQDLLRDPMSCSQADILVARAMPRAQSVSAAPMIEPLPQSNSEATHRAPENYEEEFGVPDSHQQAQREQGKVPKWLKLPGKK